MLEKASPVGHPASRDAIGAETDRTGDAGGENEGGVGGRNGGQGRTQWWKSGTPGIAGGEFEVIDAQEEFQTLMWEGHTWDGHGWILKGKYWQEGIVENQGITNWEIVEEGNLIDHASTRHGGDIGHAENFEHELKMSRTPNCSQRSRSPTTTTPMSRRSPMTTTPTARSQSPTSRWSRSPKNMTPNSNCERGFEHSVKNIQDVRDSRVMDPRSDRFLNVVDLQRHDVENGFMSLSCKSSSPFINTTSTHPHHCHPG